MSKYEMFLSSSLEKVFPTRRPTALEADTVLSAWRNTRASIQLVYKAVEEPGFMPLQEFKIEVKGAPSKVSIRKVELIPSDFPCYGERDEDYITTTPGLFPDLLRPTDEETIVPLPGQYRSLWISFDLPEDVKPGQYRICIKATAVDKIYVPNGTIYEDEEVKNLVIENEFTLHVGRAVLPEQELIHTEWFHADCLAAYYKTEVFDEEHWRIIENFIRAAGQKHGINMILTPVFTPPLDTARGKERMTVQLVDVRKEGGTWSFDFTKLERWAKICKRCGIRYLEIAHFFTQWGATSAPKILAEVDGEVRQIFGWDTRAAGEEYREFLHAFLPQLQEKLEMFGYDKEHVYYHISDEPSPAQMEDYRAARNLVKEELPEDQIIDALSSLEFYKKGIVPHPIPGTSEVDEFYEAKVPNLWVYYCCAQCKDVPNRFFAMESARNRIMGVLMYLYDIKGFLHWGYNFYSSKYSLYPVNPYQITHAGYAFPSGDAYLVYLGEDGEPLDSIRVEVQDEGLLDLRALKYLESLTDRKFVENLIYEGTKIQSMSFKNYPKSAKWILDLREKIANEIELREQAL